MFERIDMSALEQELIALRREFHRYPETGWTELRTSVRIIEELEKEGIPVAYGPAIHVAEKRYAVPPEDVLERHRLRALEETERAELVNAMAGGFTGCVACIEGALPGPAVGLRVDIDSNHLQESGDPAHRPAAEGFASVHDGCMHACGHDAHAAIGVGAAERIWKRREALRGTVRVVFQPAEEGLRGAKSMTKAGVLQDAERLFGLHAGICEGETGTVAASVKGILSGTKFDAVFHGVPAHAGICPEKGRNALAAAAKATLDLLAIPQDAPGLCRVNVGTLHGGTGRNVIPAFARMAAETRGETPEQNKAAEERAFALCRAAAQAYGCTVELIAMGGAEGARCDEDLALWAQERIRTLPGVKEVLREAYFGGGEDITTMMSAVQQQGGSATELLLCMPLPYPHHSSRFDIAEEVIPLGVEILERLAMGE